jgi:hypothetical protein
MIKSSKYVYLNFEDNNSDLVTRPLKMNSLYKTVPILQRCSDYLLTLKGFNLPINAMPNKQDIKQINIRTSTIPVKQTFLNTVQAIQPSIIYSYYPSTSELKDDNLVLNITDPTVYVVLESNEQLNNIDLYVEVVYASGKTLLQIASGNMALISLQFKYSVSYTDL